MDFSIDDLKAIFDKLDISKLEAWVKTQFDALSASEKADLSGIADNLANILVSKIAAVIPSDYRSFIVQYVEEKIELYLQSLT